MHIKDVQRRLLLKGLAGAGSLAVLGFPLSALAEAGSLQAHSLGERFSLITGAGGNVVLYRGNAGLTMIDSGLSAHSEALLALVNEQIEAASISRLFNTHWHPDHSGGNEALKAQGAKIIAHENTRLWLGADFDVPWRNKSHTPRPAAAMPDDTFHDSGSMDLGGETVEYIHMPRAHTDGDIYLWFPDSNVMVAGGLLSNYRYPICDIATGGWIGGLLDANADMLSRADSNTVIVPDRGPALGRQDLQAQHDMLADLYEQMKELARMGYSGHDMLDAGVTSAYDGVWGDPEEFVLETYRGMWAHTYEMGGFI